MRSSLALAHLARHRAADLQGREPCPTAKVGARPVRGQSRPDGVPWRHKVKVRAGSWPSDVTPRRMSSTSRTKLVDGSVRADLLESHGVIRPQPGARGGPEPGHRVPRSARTRAPGPERAV